MNVKDQIHKLVVDFNVESDSYEGKEFIEELEETLTEAFDGWKQAAEADGESCARVEELHFEIDKANLKIEELKRENICDVCAGTGTGINVPSKPCICSGTGLASRAFIGMREKFIDLNAITTDSQLDKVKEEVEGLKAQLQEEMTDYAMALKEHTSQLTEAKEEIVSLNDEVEEQAAGRRHIQKVLSEKIAKPEDTTLHQWMEISKFWISTEHGELKVVCAECETSKTITIKR